MKITNWLVSFFILGSIILGILALIFLSSLNAPGPLQQARAVVIPKGTSVSEIAEILQTENIIASPLNFKSAARIFGSAQKLQAGEYYFEAEMPLIAVLEKLERGDVIERYITIPEGLSSYEVVQILNENEFLSGEISTIPPEGSLLPETYQFQGGDRRSEKLKRMQENMNKALDELWPERQENLPFATREEAVIIASIVEKETGMAKERDKVAEVFLNRLEIGMPLQTDPTVIYALTQGRPKQDGQGPLGRRLLREDLKIDSPYNTYKYRGLPPGPICNPGHESLSAVLQPAEHDYLYFVADGTGGHAFAKTLDEHHRNVAEWRKIRAKKESIAEQSEISGPLFDE